jgi:hypothetical protein
VNGGVLTYEASAMIQASPSSGSKSTSEILNSDLPFPSKGHCLAMYSINKKKKKIFKRK